MNSEFYDFAVTYNPCLIKSVKRPTERAFVFKDLGKMSFQKLAEKYVPVSRREKFKRFINSVGLLKAVP